MPAYLSEPSSGARVRDEDMTPKDFIESCYPHEAYGISEPHYGAEFERKHESARRGTYYGDSKPEPRPDLETLSLVVNARNQNDRIERMLRYLIAKLPVTPAPVNP